MGFDSIRPFKVAGQIYSAPYQSEVGQFQIHTLNPVSSELVALSSAEQILPDARPVPLSIAQTFMPVEWLE